MTDTEHLENLDLVLRSVEETGLHITKENCSFKLPSVEYLGHKVSAAGLQPIDVKIQAIMDAPAPQNRSSSLTQVKSGTRKTYSLCLPVFGIH